MITKTKIILVYISSAYEFGSVIQFFFSQQSMETMLTSFQVGMCNIVQQQGEKNTLVLICMGC